MVTKHSSYVVHELTMSRILERRGIIKQRTITTSAKQPFRLADMTNSDRPSATSGNIPRSHRPSQSVAVCQDWAQNFTYWHRIAQMLQSSKTTLRQYGGIANLTLHPVAQIEASLAIEFESNKWRISGPGEAHLKFRRTSNLLALHIQRLS